jgi:hypothetical protein
LPIYEITKTEVRKLNATTFADEGISERNDLQRLLVQNIEMIAAGTLIIAEEFCEWEDSKRRIDLLGVDRQGNLVVIELKRTEDGGHMELQALRYAAMVSAMTFAQATDIYAAHLAKPGRSGDAKEELLNHISDETAFGQDVRIILVSAEFSKEITTSVLWLNERMLDITCVRLRPYSLEGRVLLDVQQVIPLPEAAGYTVQLKQKAEEIRAAKKWDIDFSKYDLTVDSQTIPALSKRALVFEAVKFAITRGVGPEEIGGLVPPSKWLSVDGEVETEQFWALLHRANPKQLQYSPKRYFCGSDELFHLNGRTYVLSNQWSIDTISVVEALAQRFPALKINYAKSGE